MPSQAVCYVKIAVDAPIARHFDYRLPPELLAIQVGAWVVVPWGKSRKLGIVFAIGEPPELAPERIRNVIAIREGAPVFDAAWLRLIEFTATYYHRGLGEVAISAIPKLLRTLDRKRQTDVFQKLLLSFNCAGAAQSVGKNGLGDTLVTPVPKRLTAEQQLAYELLCASASQSQYAPSLMLGVTGSGKTEVYLRWIKDLLAKAPTAQILLLVPEINLTPGLMAHLHQTFPQIGVAVLHSGLNESTRAANWLASATGKARLIVGTRLAILTPIPNLAAIVVDEEHDSSFKQHEGVHYSARDLSLVLAQQRKIPVILASATPSLESWRAANQSRYQLLELKSRATGASSPRVIVVPLGSEKHLKCGLTAVALEAIERALKQKQQALVFINRRGYAPVIHCTSCGWLSQCENCSAFKVLHRKPMNQKSKLEKTPYLLICHHCAQTQSPPRQCPTCGGVDLLPLGRGTQKIEEGLALLFPNARIGRLDRDSAQRKGATQKFLDAAHAGEVDILVGTQMLAKGHDFQRLSEVIVVDSDAGLFSADFRAPERLFATLMQVAGRAGRALGVQGTVTIQTRFVEHSLFDYLKTHDYAAFANTQLQDREAAHLPPYSFQALLRSEAKTVEQAITNLSQIREHGLEQLSYFNESSRAQIQICDPVPMPLAKLAGRGRAQLLIESGSRPVLHQWLSHWLPQLKLLPVRWHIEIDPIEI